jgi:hypothetical protein
MSANTNNNSTEAQIEASYTEDQINVVVLAIRRAIRNETLSAVNILTVVVSGMVAAGNFVFMAGASKKRLVIYCINRVIDEANLGGNDKVVLKMMVDTVINAAVDIIINASKGEYTFARKSFCSCFSTPPI